MRYPWLKFILCLAFLTMSLGTSSSRAQDTPIFSEPFSCPTNEIFHTVKHADLTTGSLPGGIAVVTAVTDIAGTTTVSTPGITLAGAGSGFVATTPFIDGGGALRFVNTDNEAAQVIYNFAVPLTNPFIFIQSDGPEQGTDFQLFEADGITPIAIVKIDGDSEVVVTGGSLIENTDPSAGAQNHTAYFQVQDSIARSTIILRVTNNVPHALDGYNVGIGSCVADPTVSFPIVPPPANTMIYTVEHTDLTQGTLPFGNNVTTTVTSVGTPTVSTINASGLASAFVNTVNFIAGGGGLRFVTTDTESVDVAFTFSSPITNPFIFIGIDGPEPNTITQLFEADGTTPISFVKIDGEDAFGVNWGTTIVNTDSTATNRTGYVQVQDNVARTQFVLRVANGGVFGLDGYNVGIGAAVAPPPPTNPPQNTPIFSEPFSCPTYEFFHTVEHADLTTGSLPGGIAVLTAVSDITGTTTVSTPGITLAGAGSGFVTTTPFIDGGGALRFVNTDNEAAQVVYTFSTPLTNPFIFIQSDGPEQGTDFQLFEANGITPIPITRIDGDPEIVVTGGSLIQNTDPSAGAQNHTGYFQVQDSAARSTIILRVTNNTPHALDGYNVGIGSCARDPAFVIADVSVTKDDGVTSAVPGQENVVYTIVAANAGPDEDPAVAISDIFPPDLSCSTTSTAENGAGGNTAGPTAGNINEILSMPAGSSVIYTATCSIAPSATGTLVNTAAITGSEIDLVPDNNNATDDNTVLVPTADIGVTKTDGVTTAVPGEGLTYTLAVTNNGPSDDPVVSFTDTFPAGLTCAYTSVAAGGATGNTAAGAGDLAETLSMPAGGLVTYTVNCAIDASLTGTLVNTATAAGSFDTVPGNDSATDDDTVLRPLADLSVTKIDDIDPITTGGDVFLNYEISIANSGPSTAQSVISTETLPAAMADSQVVFNGTTGDCLNNPDGVPDCQLGTLLPGESRTYTVELMLHGNLGDSILINSVTVSSPTEDPNLGNNTVTEETATQPTPTVPTISTWGLVLLAGLLGLLGLLRHRAA